MARVRASVRIVIVAACLLLVGTAQASAANCGAKLIDEYFNTGRIGYHPQDCYASALKQIDPDARMYSGIMGAIRAARARDRARDNAKDARDTPTVDPAPIDTVPIDPQPTVPVDTTAMPTDTAPVDTAIPTLPPEPSSAASVPATQAAAIEEAASAGVPLSVAVFAGLAALLTIVGLAGLAVRRLDRGY